MAGSQLEWVSQLFSPGTSTGVVSSGHGGTTTVDLLPPRMHAVYSRRPQTVAVNVASGLVETSPAALTVFCACAAAPRPSGCAAVTSAELLEAQDVGFSQPIGGSSRYPALLCPDASGSSP